MTDFYTSDPHFNHRNIIKYCNRPFGRDPVDPEILHWRVHDAELIRRWNSRVQPGDHVYVLGDFAMCPAKYYMRRVAPILAQLHGTKTLVRGNHDPDDGMLLIEAGFTEDFAGDPSKKGGLLNGDLLLVHQPPTALEWFAAKQEHPQLKWCFCGHVHEKWKKRADGVINVGVDVWDWYPRTREEIIGC